MKYILTDIYIYIYIYIKNKKEKILKISIFLVKVDLKSWLIVPKGQLNARQSFPILKVS